MTPPTMRAVTQDRFGGPEVLRVQEVPRPEPLPTEVLVRVHAAGINPVDWKTRAGAGMAGVLGQPPFVLGRRARGAEPTRGPPRRAGGVSERWVISLSPNGARQGQLVRMSGGASIS